MCVCVCVCVCECAGVCGLRMGPFPWFHSSAIRMCSSVKEFGNVFLKQTRKGREKKGRERVSERFLWGSGHVSAQCGVIFILGVCVCVSTAELFDNSERWGVYWSHTKCREERNLWFQQKEKGGRGRAEGRRGVKTGLFEAADLFITVLLLPTLTFE